MADYIVTSGELTSVANAIREKNGTSSSLSWPNGFVSGIGSGGGGSSDFSTATLTVNGDLTQSDLFIAPGVEKDPNNEDIAFPMIQSGNSTYTVILYKGRSTLMYMGRQSRTITVSGNIETVDTGIYIITGDCTITISQHLNERVCKGIL